MIKSLLFALFLYVCLVWVGVAYFYSGPEIQQVGLLWTAVGLIALLVFIVGGQILSWWRLRRARAATRPPAAPKPATPVHEDNIALAALIAEANATLAKAPRNADQLHPTQLSNLPLYLLIGPDGSAKTSTFVNSGVDPQLLAGQVSGVTPIIPTRLCNLWLAQEAVFVEFGGRVFSGDVERWKQLLGVLRGKQSVPRWHWLWKEPEPGLKLAGVVAFSDVKEVTATSNSQRLDRLSREWQERLNAVGEVFSVEFPVYQLITKCDGIPFFKDFFRHLPELDANQVLGCTL